MLEIDHLMVEVRDPLEAASNVSERLGLPYAWPLMEKEEYTSIGVNFGDINIEFINFRVRFGVKNKQFTGFSGIAFKTESNLDEATDRLRASGLNYRLGETCEAHTTVPIEDGQVFPTLFLVKYHFDTSGWTQRLQSEFTECHGGKFNIGCFKSLKVNTELPFGLKGEKIAYGDRNQIVFESSNGEGVVISDLTENLDIVIAPFK
ncbi:hypothetical protein [Marinobacterium lacunae]|uniref:hypothetical protein n=1 Tax=Marinobacterium lacunae TaxID=1232683 RepID=UPI00056A6EFE|nr:hypothetical protein [Marinobacterium lacunae]